MCWVISPAPHAYDDMGRAKSPCRKRRKQACRMNGFSANCQIPLCPPLRSRTEKPHLGGGKPGGYFCLKTRGASLSSIVIIFPPRIRRKKTLDGHTSPSSFLYTWTKVHHPHIQALRVVVKSVPIQHFLITTLRILSPRAARFMRIRVMLFRLLNFDQ